MGSTHTGNGNVEGVIFDMDGTLTRPCLDFDLIRAQIGLSADDATPILEAVERMSPVERALANVILERHEYDAAARSELHEGALEVIEAIRARDVPVGLLTRNSRICTSIVIERHQLKLDWVHTREDGPVKPAPDAIVAMCRQWRATPSNVWMVGDYLFDILAGQSAGTRTVLMIGDDPLPEYAHQANHVIRRLPELLLLMK
jgi:HAD superfamily hydrolase (TIGR01549 family)